MGMGSAGNDLVRLQDAARKHSDSAWKRENRSWFVRIARAFTGNWGFDENFCSFRDEGEADRLASSV